MTAKWIKKLTHDNRFIHSASKIVSVTATAWLASCRYHLFCADQVEEVRRSGIPTIVATWHCGILPILYYFRREKTAVMVSPSHDGEWIEKVVSRWGFICIRGSSGKHGSKAARKMIRYLKSGYHGGLVVDGSRGPAFKVQKGAIFLAKVAQVPILPIGVSAKPVLRLPTWDRMMLPLPFSRIFIRPGRLIHVGHNADIKKLAEYLETYLNELYGMRTIY
ncbi:MAG: lysophospholipid acyltransferase family protein [Deltaproteobacteria bacterium]|nr:lysophospholipid acyltransferase family protein [Deltaproteobacteria bacterium]MBW2068591.1 lysophospholipid acyltransferase family protein [Deltaproteobacteria bacterium]